MKFRTSFLPLVIFFTVYSINSNAQMSTNVPTSLSANSGRMNTAGSAPDSRGWTDPALNHNRLIQQRQDGGYQLIGAYKVTGSPYLFGEHHKADMFATEAKAYNIYISYNTYNQEIEFYSTSNPDKALVKELGTVDSFTIQQNIELGITTSLKFVYGSVLGVKDKYYFQEVCKGSRYTLYKRYKSDLGYVSSNYVQSDLRQFDLEIEYYYADAQGKGIKKIKPNAASVIKEFKDVKDLSNLITTEEFTTSTETAFCKVLSLLNDEKSGF